MLDHFTCYANADEERDDQVEAERTQWPDDTEDHWLPDHEDDEYQRELREQAADRRAEREYLSRQ